MNPIEIARLLLVPVPWVKPPGTKHPRGDPRKELAQLTQTFRECAPGAGAGVVWSPSRWLDPFWYLSPG